VNEAAVLGKALLFDMDGVLVDSTAAVERAWTDFARRHDLDVGFVMARTHGRRTAETLSEVAPHLDAETEAVRMEREEVARAAEVHALPGARELVDHLPQFRWGVVTSATRDLALARLKANEFTLPPVLISADDVARGKPDPECYLTAAREIGEDPTDCVVFEDAPPGIEAARRAGAKVVGVATTYGPAHLDGVDWCIESLAAVRLEFGGAGWINLRLTTCG
jgi:HAD superfamily hydrolase (TIGR01509 family)